ncbi:hypothetical protein [Uliginosibacterium sp. 31-12]|uniref:hypothetical protein n=1 Tax=Uliginosibacterium sp. 31-12 TaxID=3062781 RepID=UPI0026E3FB01|nr:hypothetical protein [Uliginosibacterium sp. 31-12]MDO6385982.1 hypothetical protein [Uliginosibacterium sp. 31-12]
MSFVAVRPGIFGAGAPSEYRHVQSENKSCLPVDAADFATINSIRANPFLYVYSLNLFSAGQSPGSPGDFQARG